MELSLIQKVAVFALPVLFAITLHEAAHAFVARYFGDMTAYAAGRVSLNPLRHIDPLGTIIIPLLTLVLTPFMFGWAKPVPVDFGRLRHPKRDMAWVALAGPASNLAMAIAWALSLRLTEGEATGFWAQMALAGVQINLVLMALNLFPLPPLDGGRIAFSLLPQRLAWQYAKLEPYGLLIVLVLLATGVLWTLLGPLLMVGRWIVLWFV